MNPSNQPIAGSSEEQNKGLFEQVVSDSDKQELILYSLLPQNDSLTQDNLLSSISSISNQVANILGIGKVPVTFIASGTWTRPSSGTFLFIECFGAGGGGGAAYNNGSIATGGGGGGYRAQLIPLFYVSKTVTVTIGAAGLGASVGVNTGSNGTVGGSTSFGSYVSANGGAAGVFSLVDNSFSGGTGGTSGAGSILTISAEAGGNGGAASNAAGSGSSSAGANTNISGPGGGGAYSNQFGTQGASAGGTSTIGNIGGHGATSTGADAIATVGTGYGAGGGAASGAFASITVKSSNGTNGFCRITVI